MLDSADPAVRALAPLESDAEDRPALAERIRRNVRRHITAKTLDVGFATASEVARTKQGDCTEHAVLLAAALRSVGIPSRVASGVIYVDQFAGGREVFGFHMWTQALLDGAGGKPRWVDLDATLPDAAPFDAAHISMVLSALPAEERMNSLAALAPMLGRLKIEVVETE
jgi:transglutaminase-like putative cysteine protease